jgi:hypothetical protein
MDINTQNRMQRLNEAYKHLYAFHGIASKTALADKLKVQRTGLSAALNGSKANLTDNLFMKICAAFPGVFNLDYLLTGTGTLLAAKEKAEPTPVSPATDNILELHAQMIRRVDDLRQELHDELMEVRQLKDELRATLSELKQSNNRDLGIAAETLDEH